MWTFGPHCILTKNSYKSHALPFLRVPFFFLLMGLGSPAPLWFTNWKVIAISLAEVFSSTYLQAVSYNRSDELTSGLDVKRSWHWLVYWVCFLFFLTSTSWVASNWVFFISKPLEILILSLLCLTRQGKKLLWILDACGPYNPLWVECMRFVFL